VVTEDTEEIATAHLTVFQLFLIDFKQATGRKFRVTC